MATTRLTRAGRWAAAEILERLPLVLLGDGSPLIAATAAVLGLLTAWPGDRHPPLLVQHFGHLELWAWSLSLLVGAAVIYWGMVTRQWRVQIAGLMLAGTGLVVYGIAFAASSTTDSAGVGTPPIVLGAGAVVRMVIIAAIGVTWEAREAEQPGGSGDDARA